jgi:ABC-type glycerol-3-phosphate transport system permease component
VYEKVKKVKPKKRFIHNKVNRSTGGNITIFVMLTLFGTFTALPLYLSIINSLKPLNELWIFPPKFYVINPTLKNFSELFTIMSDSVVPFSRYIFNTVFITLTGVVGQVLIGSMCAYPLAKHNYPGSKIFFKIIFLSLMFTPAVIAIPNYLIVARLGMVDTYSSIIIPAIGGTLAVYLMKQFMEQIHDSLLEAAKIDGANEYRIYWSIVMPNIKAAWLTVVVFGVQRLWTMGSSTFIYSENLKTLNYALGQIVNAGIARAGVAAAVAVIMMSVPIITFIITQSNVIETMSSSGVKE